MKIKNLSLAVVTGMACLLNAGTVMADETLISPANRSGPAGSLYTLADGNDPFFIRFVADGGEDTGSFEIQVTFPAELTIAPVPVNAATAECAVISPGRIRIQVSSATPLTTADYCRLDVTVDGGAAVGDYDIEFDAATALYLVVAPPFDTPSVAPHTFTNGSVSVVAGPTPPILSIADGTANGAGVGTAAVTKVDGSGAPTSSYTCTAPAGFTLTSNASGGPFSNGGPDPADIGFSCSPGAMAVTQAMNCTITEGGTPRADSVDLTCPALAPFNPTITSSPADGSTTNIPGGLIGATRSTTINFTATGANALGAATIDCSASGAVSIAPSGPQPIAGTAQPVDPSVSCTLTDVEQTGSVTCSITDGNPSATRTTTYDFVCPAGSTFLPSPEPTVVTATSLWSKIGLIGLLAALGMLMVGFRRNH